MSKELPSDDVPDDLCAREFYLAAGDRAVVTTADRRILEVDTDDAEGQPDLTTVAVHDLSDVVPDDDCVVGLAPDWSGRIWFATRLGRVGVVPRGGGAARVTELGEAVTNSIAVDADGGSYVVTDEALYRLGAGASGPTVTWRAAYDRGDEQKPGQLSQGSGTTPTLLPGGLVAITDNAEPRMQVVVLDRSDGSEVCRAAVFGADEGATESSLVAVGSGVIVENNHGSRGLLSTALGMTTDGGLARVDVAGGECSVAWRSDAVAPQTAPVLSQRTGLVYAHTLPHSWWGVTAWYLTAIDARTGRTVFSVRTGVGRLFADRDGAVTLGPDGAAYVATRAGLVRVHDREEPEADAGQG